MIQEILVLRVLEETQAHQEHQEILVLKALKGLRDQLVIQDPVELLGHPETLVHQGHKVQLVQLVLLDPQGPLAQLVL